MVQHHRTVYHGMGGRWRLPLAASLGKPGAEGLLRKCRDPPHCLASAPGAIEKSRFAQNLIVLSSASVFTHCQHNTMLHILSPTALHSSIPSADGLALAPRHVRSFIETRAVIRRRRDHPAEQIAASYEIYKYRRKDGQSKNPTDQIPIP